jgi:undecaprenyl-diphosphatase
MDNFLLIFFNRTLAHPVLDLLMLALTYGGLGLLPGLGIVLLRAGHRRAGQALLFAMVVSVALTLICQAVALRPRPEAVRRITPAPNFPSFPSGHAAAAFATASVLGLAFRRRGVGPGAMAVAGLICLSRLYLGLHYPTDILGGALIGASVGAACYGLIIKQDWRWLLWPQIALVLVVTEMAYLNLIPRLLQTLPYFDKSMHLLGFGAVTFWLNLWLAPRLSPRGSGVPLAILLPLIFALIEESLQSLSPYRTFDVWDLASDFLGIVFFWWVSQQFLRPSPQPEII